MVNDVSVKVLSFIGSCLIPNDTLAPPQVLELEYLAGKNLNQSDLVPYDQVSISDVCIA